MERFSRIRTEKTFSRLLLKWWGKNKRTFPWRLRRDPYAVLIAEMLLRKTTAKQVEKVYEDFISRYPSPPALSEADMDGPSNILTPLGMEHKRAELFIRLGRAIQDNPGGRIPSTEKALLKLPGVGQYAANAVLSFSHGRKVPMVDTNFIRVIQRVFGLTSSKARARNDKQLWEFAEKLVPRRRSREFNLAVLDFAALICKYGNPQCGKCPIISICTYGLQRA